MSARRTPQPTDPLQNSRDRGPEAVRIRLLGGFSVSVGSRTIRQEEWRSKKAATLVKLLALAPGHRMHREQAMDLLWPDSAEGKASNNLRQVLYSARKVLDPASGSPGRYLGLQDEQLVLCPEGQLWVDVEAFEDAAATARRSRDPAAYRAAIEPYAGELLPEDRYEEWAEGRREQLRQLYLKLITELAALYEERDQYGPAIEVLRKAITEEPTNEDAHSGLMRLFALLGRKAEALAQFERLEEALSAHPGAEPGAKTARLRGELVTGAFPPARAQPSVPSSEQPPGDARHNLPTPRDNFVGRGREILEVKRELAMTRLLTLTGPGGSGKTRLALEVARDLVGAYSDGVWLVELDPLSEEELVPQAVARALGLREQPGQSLDNALIDALRQKETLLVLDNCEHLVEAAARLAEALLSPCPHLHLLATSREALGVAGEARWSVPPLSVPGSELPLTVGELERYESVRLFADRASKRHPGFELSPENARAVAQICARLEGLPLAIELAAARVGLLSAEQISARLGHATKLLTGGRTAGHRHRTLRATLDWSYELLGGHEQALFRRLSAFAGGFTLEAAESVGTGGSIDAEDVLELLSMLVDKSLVVAEESWEAGARYRLLEPIRQYARERLSVSGEGDAVGRRHAAFFLALAEEAEPELKGPRQARWLDRLETEHDNFRAALSWALGRGADLGPPIACALSLFWYTRDYLSEGRTYLEAAASSDVAPATVRAKALVGLGWIAEPQGDYERASAAYEESLKLYRECDDKRGVANALGDLGSLALDRGDYEQASSLLEESLRLHRELGSREDVIGVLDGLGVLASAKGDRDQAISFFSEALVLSRGLGNVRRTASSLGNLGITVLVHGDTEEATALLEESLAQFRRIGDVSNIAVGLVYLALAALTQGDHERARVLCRESLELLQKAENRHLIADCLEVMAAAAAAQGGLQRAARLWGAAGALRAEIGVPQQPEDSKLLDPYLAAARFGLGEAAWQTLLAEGRAMVPEQSVDYALSAEEPILPHPGTHLRRGDSAALSPRGEEIAVLVSRGLTNRQIASELSISEHTVATHMTKMLKRLGLNSRSTLSAWVAERGLSQTDQGDSRGY